MHEKLRVHVHIACELTLAPAHARTHTCLCVCSCACAHECACACVCDCANKRGAGVCARLRAFFARLRVNARSQAPPCLCASLVCARALICTQQHLRMFTQACRFACLQMCTCSVVSASLCAPSFVHARLFFFFGHCKLSCCCQTIHQNSDFTMMLSNLGQSLITNEIIKRLSSTMAF